MTLLSIQILLINFIVAGIISAVIYFSNKSVRYFNPLILFIISSLGSFLGTVVGMFVPNFGSLTSSYLVNNLLLFIPGITFSLLFILISIKGSRSNSYI